MEDDVPGVAILPRYQGKIVLEQHYRHGPRIWMTEVPRGFGEAGYSAEENAQRELMEEIGATVAHLELLGKVRPNASSIGGYDCLFFAELSAVGTPDAGEAIAQIILVPLEEFHQMIADGAITDGFTLSAYAYARAKNIL
jgi:ADP-ribose pyrophosphatase